MDRADGFSVHDLHSAFRSGSLTPSRLVDDYLRRIELLDRAGPQLRAVNTVSQAARDEAREWDRRWRGSASLPALAGIPVVLKDHIETRGLRTTFGSVAAAGYVPDRDADVVVRLRRAGAIILGKTAMADFGASWFSTSSFSGFAKNPYALDHDPGGSSSGTAVCVAADLCAVGIGGDTGGSIRVPASFCNIVGLRPTPGVVSTRGVAPLLSRQDTVGPMARTVADAARVFEAIRAPDARRAPVRYPPESRPIRLGRVEQLVASADAPGGDVTAVFRRRLRQLEDGNVRIADVEIGSVTTLMRDSSLYLVESRRELDEFLRSRFGPEAGSVANLYADGRFHPALDLFEAIATTAPEQPEAALTHALRARATLKQRVLDVLDRGDLDALCFPSVQVGPPTHRGLLAGEWTTLDYPTNTVLAAQTGLPAMSVPFGFTATGLPVGVELVGRPFDEETLLRVAARVEEIVPARRSAGLEVSRTGA